MRANETVDRQIFPGDRKSDGDGQADRQTAWQTEQVPISAINRIDRNPDSQIARQTGAAGREVSTQTDPTDSQTARQTRAAGRGVSTQTDQSARQRGQHSDSQRDKHARDRRRRERASDRPASGSLAWYAMMKGQGDSLW